jgi:hypothetical protein
MMPDWAEELETDLQWREAELVSLKLLAVRTKDGTVEQKALLRVLWAMLYAHYEGFCKSAFEIYLGALKRLGPRRCDCRDELAVFSINAKFRKLGGNLSNDNCVRFVNELSTLLNETISFDQQPDIRGNLYANILCENCQCVCLPFSQVEENERMLNALVSRRNDIAHGKNVPVKSLSEYKRYEDAAFTVMCALAVDIIDVLERGLYLKTV